MTWHNSLILVQILLGQLSIHVPIGWGFYKLSVGSQNPLVLTLGPRGLNSIEPPKSFLGLTLVKNAFHQLVDWLVSRVVQPSVHGSFSQFVSQSVYFSLVSQSFFKQAGSHPNRQACSRSASQSVVNLSVSQSVNLSVSLSVSLLICQSVNLSVC